MVKKNNNVLLMVGVLVVGLIAGLIGGAVGSSITGDVTLSNNAAGTGTYRIRPEGTYADTWLPYRDCSIYLTSNGKKSGGDIVFRKWTGGTSFTQLAKIDSSGNLAVNNIYTKAEVNNLMKNVYNEINDTKDKLVDRMRAAEVVSFSDSIAPTNCVSVCEARHKSCNIAISEYASCPASEITCPANNVALKTIKDKSVISCGQSFQTGVLNNMSKSLSCVCI